MTRKDVNSPGAKDRRMMRMILTMVGLGWLAALAFMAFAALYWDKG